VNCDRQGRTSNKLKLSERKIEPVYSIGGLCKSFEYSDQNQALGDDLHHIERRHTPIRFAALVVDMESAMVMSFQEKSSVNAL
jgi:hypothetical protein